VPVSTPACAILKYACESLRAVSEVVGAPLPYDDVLFLRDRMWEISPTLVRYDVVEPTSHAVATLGVKQLSSTLAAVNAKNLPFSKPITNFYQTDVISRACVITSTPDKANV
jgi:NADH dehydrogenase (ubiquinone) Fe-S protein 1